ncbi:Outer dense fiber protein 3 [Phytophthora citrophthora]|uniref:Outer dense fiber protein 3 n=1 Tax=Phytophthora citrophthora TaxID=4793 RepID=A0AAD9GYV2_9STRA|nr:Outer dense fiber protein 3 [Phytophthora citrophthora]
MAASPRAQTSPSKSLGGPVHQVYTDVKSSCGEQVDSRKATAPYPVFGSGNRQYNALDSKAPGPGTYQIPSSIGKPVLSTMAQAPSCSIAGREKFGSTADLSASGRQPGPGDYTSDIVNPRERAAPSYSLGKKWSNMGGDERIPGPGAYESSTTIGRTVLSTQKSNPVSSFPKVERKPLHGSGTADVGPGQYSVVVESVGRQAVSTVATGASYSFGTESRSKADRSTGASRYYDPKSSVGTQVESTYRTAPKCSMSGRPQTSNKSPPRPLGSPTNQTFTDVKSSCGGQVDSRKATAPGAVFGSGTRPHTTSGSKAPGPGAYQIPSTIGKPVLSTMAQAPSCSIAGREKFGSTADLSASGRQPGPGDYTSDIVNPRERAAPSYSLGKKWSNMGGDERIPGPGAYESSTTIGRTVLSTQKSNPVSSFPKVERKPLHGSGTADVGPGQYSVVVESVGRQAVSTVATGASYSFGTESRSKADRSTGASRYYDPKSSVGTQVESTYRTAPKCSMSGRPQTSNKSPPRPLGSPTNQTFTDVKSSCGGQVDSRKATAPGAVFGSGTRPHTTSGSKAPGPGAYQIPSTIGKPVLSTMAQAPSCSIAGREKFGSTADLSASGRQPGPGDYTSDIVNPRERAAPSYSLGKKWSNMGGDERIPGPGAYESSTTIGRTVLSTQKSNPVSSFPKVERKPLHGSGTADVGPGQYSVVVESVGRQAVSTVATGASYSFGTESRSKADRSTGASRYYDPKSSVGTQVESTYRTAPKCSMSGRPQTSNKSPPRPLGSPTNQTFTDVKSSCGGQVDSRKATAPGAVFGSGTRPHTTSGSKAPGPGAYQIPSTIGKPVLSTMAQAPSCSIAGREKFGSTADLSASGRQPGPGDYTSDIVNPRERAAPSYSLGKKWSNMGGDERIPGPGAYESSTTIGRTVLSTQKSNPVSSFPKVERKPLHGSGTADVGPGQYSVVVESVGRQAVSTVATGASYSFGTESRSKADRSTGASRYYDPKSSVGTQVESTYRTAPKCSMSGRPQTSNKSPPRPLGSPTNQTFTDVKSSCGGQVDSRKATAPGAVFGSGTRPHTTSGSKAPGPGAYQIPSTIGKPVLSTMAQAPSCSIAGREKFGSTADLSASGRQPGPGDYTSDIVNPRERAAPSYSLGKKWSNMGGDERIPGPGAYESSTTIGRTVLSTQKSNPVSSFPKVERKPLHGSGTADVGPGQYSVVVESVGRQAVSTVATGASYSFGTESRSKADRSTGASRYYDPKSSVGTQVESTYRTAPKCSMSGRPQTSNKSPPRPLGSPTNQTFTDVKSSCGGQVDSRKATAPGAVFGSGTRPHTTSGSKAPGPGAYQIPSTIGKPVLSTMAQAPSCSIAGREKFGSTADLSASGRQPGPGDYTSDIVNPRERAAPSYSLGKKWSNMGGDERIPGPGAYESSTTIGRTVLSTQKSNPVSSFPKVERKPLHGSGTADVGPGQYSVVVESVGRQAVSTVATGASYSFGTESRSKADRSTGASRYYDPKSSVGTQVESTYRTAPKCSMSGRPQTSNKSPPRPLGSPTNQTFTDVKSSCGGQVDSRKATAPGAVFGSGTRPHTTSGSKAPGPGAYQIPSTIGKPVLSTMAQAPSCSIAGREKFGSTADLSASGRQPGPGDYTSDIVNPRERAAPSYSLGKKWSNMGGDERIPGPGAYESSTTIGRTVLSTQKSNPVSSFPKVERKPLHGSGTADVGPGQYSVVVESVGRQAVSTVATGASYSFGTESRSKADRSTGASRYYDPKSSVGTQVESTYRTAPKCSMSGRPQTSNKSPPRPLGSPTNQTFTDVKSSCGGQVDSRKATAPGAVFGSGTRPHTTSGSKAPGPGAYQIPSTIGKPVLSTMAQAPSCSIAGREKFGSTADLSASGRQPGPGDYTSDIVNPRERAAPSYSLGKKWSNMGGDERIPGPGAYESSTTIGRTVLSTQKSNPVSSFPKVERKPLHGSGTADVGPGQYSVVVESVGRQAVSTVATGASYSFGTESRSKADRSTGASRYYDPKSSVGTQVESTYRTAPKCSMSGRPQTSNKSPPRPLGSPTNQTFTDVKSSCGGQVDSRKATAPGAVFGSGTRPHTTSGSKAPGPGTYQIPSSIGKPVLSTMAQAPSCSIAGREKFGSTADLSASGRQPGPGDYTSDIVNPRERAAPSYSLGKKWSNMGGDERIPGPGAYESSTTIGRTVLSTQKSNPVSSFPKVERKPLHGSGTADVGPGQYSVVVESVGRQAVSTVATGASYSFGTESRSKADRSTGASRYYDPKSSVGTQVESTYRTAPKCSMSGRPQTSNKSPPRPLGSPTNQTFTDVKSSCGGQVDSRKATAPGAVFGSGTRPHTTSGSKAPGPGAYQIPSTIGKPVLSTMAQAPSCSIAGREKFGSTADLSASGRQPGPGDYTSDIVNPRERAAPSYSLGKKWSNMGGDERIPGPGAYESSTTIGRTVLSTQKSNPVSSFPKVERKPLHGSGTGDVGPGQYSAVVESIGRQAVSTAASGASYSFGTDTRSKSVRSTGKYKYYDPRSSVGTQAESTYPTAPKCTMSGRTKFGGHF